MAICSIITVYNLIGLYNSLSDLKAIESEQRDGINVQTCFMLNETEEQITNCLYNY